MIKCDYHDPCIHCGEELTTEEEEPHTELTQMAGWLTMPFDADRIHIDYDRQQISILHKDEKYTYDISFNATASENVSRI